MDKNNNKGIEAARAVAARLRTEIQVDRKAAAQKAIEGAKLSPAAIAYMNRNVTSGVEDLNLGVSVPQLRIHSAGVSSKNVLADGSDPSDGQIFYTGTQEAWDKVTVILLAIKKARLEKIDDDGNVVKDEAGNPILKAHYMLAGLIDESMKLFVMYVKGLSYNKIWPLEEQLRPYVTKRPGSIPLSMVKVVMSSQKETVENGKFKGQKKNVFKFDLLMHESGEFPILENQDDRIDRLEEYTESAEQMLEEIIASKGITEKQHNANKKQLNTLTDNIKNNVIDGEIDDSDFISSDGEDTPF